MPADNHQFVNQQHDAEAHRGNKKHLWSLTSTAKEQRCASSLPPRHSSSTVLSSCPIAEHAESIRDKRIMLVQTSNPIVSSPYTFGFFTLTVLPLNSCCSNLHNPSKRTTYNARRIHWSLSGYWIPHSHPASFFLFNAMDRYSPFCESRKLCLSILILPSTSVPVGYNWLRTTYCRRRYQAALWPSGRSAGNIDRYVSPSSSGFSWRLMAFSGGKSQFTRRGFINDVPELCSVLQWLFFMSLQRSTRKVSKFLEWSPLALWE